MTRLPVIELDAASGKAKEMLDELASRGGQPGPMVRAMANAPVVLRSYLARTAWPPTPALRVSLG